MITIGFDASRAFTKERTGTENYSYQLLKALAKIDHRNQYLVYIRPQLPQLASEGDAQRGWPRNFVFKQIKWPRFWTQGGLALQTFRDPLDVLFVPAHTLPLIRRPGLKTVVTVHDLGAEYLPGMHQLKQRLYLNFITHYQLKSATRLIAVSRATKDDLIKRVGIKANKISVVYEGFDKDLFKPVRGDLLVNSLRQYGLKPGSYFLFVGTVQPRKNLERLIKAFSVVAARQSTIDYTIDSPHFSIARDFATPSLVIIGQKGWLSEGIYQLPKKLGIEGRVKFLGYVPDKDMSALYSGAIALTFPSLFEGFGLPILEAQACGCPVITSNVSSMPEVAGPTSRLLRRSGYGGRARLRGVKKGAVFVNPYDVDDIVKGMERIKNLELRIKLIKAGFENIKRFSWEKCAAQALEVLESL